jgi:hypothetical protein
MSDSPDDLLASLLERLKSLPGGGYYAEMLRNNPQFMQAIRDIDPNDANATERALSAALSALGLDSSAMAAMMNMVETLKRAGFDPTTSDPAELMRAMASNPSLFNPAAFGVAPTIAPTAPRPARVEPVAPATIDVTPAAVALPETPRVATWEAAAHEAARLIAMGNERRGFEILAAALDDDATTAYDPSNFERYAGLSALLEIMAAESRAAGRQVPLRFGSLFQRYALFVGYAEPNPPPSNPEFTTWCAGIVEHATRR